MSIRNYLIKKSGESSPKWFTTLEKPKERQFYF